ncbi:DUF5518 domain-containing protein [Halapricum desulfuricans]|uniref:Putative membrane protein n=1 Tax=Halapricum desulfuricans TaxID=2841257 RepID=A0A897N8L3_9EURY|nr:DUF5518 domain-containing protein [Halapricum desulfuricans]QSG08781.1 putative membrane protein [Halapricum desulfuricans]QSG11721.1 putative membrane protein [Halapricum desulfuricans]
METATHSTSRTDAETRVAFSPVVDWIVGAILGLVGLFTGGTGAVIYSEIDRASAVEFVNDADIQTDVFTDAELVDALVAVGEWLGIGLVAAGVLTVVAGVALVVFHRQARAAGEPTQRWMLGLVGAVVSVVTGFLIVSPLLGGGVASYLDPVEHRSGFRTGALAGVFAVVPVLVVVLFGIVGAFAGLSGELVTAIAGLLAGTAVLYLLYFVGLSAVGGYVGAWIASEG